MWACAPVSARAVVCAWLQGDFDGFVVLTTSFHRDIAGVEVVCFKDVVRPPAASSLPGAHMLVWACAREGSCARACAGCTRARAVVRACACERRAWAKMSCVCVARGCGRGHIHRCNQDRIILVDGECHVFRSAPAGRSLHAHRRRPCHAVVCSPRGMLPRALPRAKPAILRPAPCWHIGRLPCSEARPPYRPPYRPPPASHSLSRTRAHAGSASSIRRG